MVDASEGLLGIEWVEGTIVKKLLPSGASEDDEDHVADAPSLTLEQVQISVGRYALICVMLNADSAFRCLDGSYWGRAREDAFG